ncbi:Dabb family protein [Vibrio sp. JC009]|uniref:Dabb family protein n=1 Tax=Vibrio sp. JC009 TaxID=2912314 RepID=UPI0023B1C7F3|nr:Dabb family protein [Vibrio sp. JC009]WED24877.1 Dabb family protein [Vibrio sp. JC009]
MIRHIMLVETRKQATQEEMDAARNAFMNIPAKIKGIEGVEWGMNDSSEGKNKSYDLAILMTFSDEETRQSYLVHPEHDALKVHFRKIIQDIVVFDYTQSEI